MLININIEPSDFDIDDPTDVSYFFSKVAESSRLGHHRIFMEFNLIKWICKDVLLIDKHKERIGELKDNPATMGIPADEPLPILEVVHGDAEITRTGKDWKIGHNKLIEYNFLEQSILLVESFYDCEFFVILLNAVANRVNYGILNFNPHPIGGKSNLSKGITKYTSKHGIVVGIVDSDRHVPDGEIDWDFSSVCELAKSKKQNICYVTLTPCHEAENFLPIDIIHNVSTQGTVKSRDLFKSLMDKPGHAEKGKCISLFYDYKRGIIGSKLLEYCDNDQEKLSWVKCRYGNHLNYKVNFPIYGQNVMKFFENQKRKNGLPIYGNKILPNFLENKEGPDKFKKFIKGEAGTDWAAHFTEWFIEFLPFFIGDEPTTA